MLVIKRIVLDITSKCNLKCPMCWGPAREINKVTGEYIDKELSLVDIRKILIFMKDTFNSKIVTINGGEPLIRKDIIDILKLAKKLEYAITLSTNAILFKYDDEFMKCLDAIAIPIDGATAKVSVLMRPPIVNQYEFAVNAIKKINRRNKNVHLKVSTVVTGINADEIIKIGEMMQASKLQIDTWKLFQYKAEGYQKDNILKKKLLISENKFNEISKAVRDKFLEYNIHTQPNSDNGLYLLIGPDGELRAHNKKEGVKNPFLGNVLKDSKEIIVANLKNVISPAAEAENIKRSYGL